jgi:3-oxoacyl-[acyl-carrier protein] reductase
MSPVELLRRGFDGASVLVVGGRGDIGMAVAGQASELGARVVVASRRADTSAKPPSAGGVAQLPVDIVDTTSIRLLCDRLRDWFGAIDVVVNAAGSTRSVPARDLHRLSDDIAEEVYGSNALGPLRLVRELLPLLQAGTDPVVVQVSSVAARTGQGSNIAYSGAKAALDAMVVAWAKAFAPIRFVNVAPTALANDFVPGRHPDFLERTIAATPMGRLATADEVATAILVAARCLSMTTGVVIAVDGGRHL